MEEETYCVDERFLRAGERHGIALLRPRDFSFKRDFFKEIKVETLRSGFYNRFGELSKFDQSRYVFSVLDRYTFSHSVDLSDLPFKINYVWSRRNSGFFPQLIVASQLYNKPEDFSQRKQLFNLKNNLERIKKLDFDVSIDYYFEFKKNENDHWKYLDYYKKDLLEILSSGYSNIKFKPIFEYAD